MTALPEQPTQSLGDQTGNDAVALRNKYAERMTHNQPQPPAMKIAIGIGVTFVLVIVIGIFLATGGFNRFASKAPAPTPISAGLLA